MGVEGLTQIKLVTIKWRQKKYLTFSTAFLQKKHGKIWAPPGKAAKRGIPCHKYSLGSNGNCQEQGHCQAARDNIATDSGQHRPRSTRAGSKQPHTQLGQLVTGPAHRGVHLTARTLQQLNQLRRVQTICWNCEVIPTNQSSYTPFRREWFDPLPRLH